MNLSNKICKGLFKQCLINKNLACAYAVIRNGWSSKYFTK